MENNIDTPMTISYEIKTPCYDFFGFCGYLIWFETHEIIADMWMESEVSDADSD